MENYTASATPDVKQATRNLIIAFEELEKTCPVIFSNEDDGGTLLQLNSVTYDPEDHRLYLELRYPDEAGGTR